MFRIWIPMSVTMLLLTAVTDAKPLLSGKVMAEDGTPIAGAKLVTLDLEGEVVTLSDKDGSYQIEGGVIIKNSLRLLIPELNVDEFHPLVGEQPEHNITIQPRILIKGSITYYPPSSDTAGDLDLKRIVFTSGKQRSRPERTEDGQGYRVYMPYGDITVWAPNERVEDPTGSERFPFAILRVPREPSVQEHNLTICYTSSNLEIQYPTGVNFQKGTLSFNPISLPVGEAMVLSTIEKPSQSDADSIPIFAGRYIVSFTSDDKLWSARQEVNLRYNETNDTILTPRPVTRGQRIAEFRSMGSPSMADITAHVIPGNTLSLIVTREESEHDQWRRYEGARIFAVDRTVIAQDMHSTVIGEHEIDNTFRFNIPENIPPGPYTFTLLHPRGGSMAWQEVFGVYLESDSR